MKKFFTFTNRISYVMGTIGFILTVAMAFMYVADVFGRLILGSQMKGTFEVAQFILCLITFSAFSLAQVTRNHIHVGFIVRHFPEKVKYLTAALSFTLCSLMGVLISYCLIYMSTTSAGEKLTSVLGLPFAPIYVSAGIFMAIFSLVIFADVLRSILAIRGDEECKAEIDRVYQ